MIRRATAEDVAGIATVQVSTWQVAYHGLIDPDFLASLDPEQGSRRWAGILASGGSDVVVAEIDGDVVGFCSSGDSSDTGWGEIYAIYVLPANWGAGVGVALLTAGEAMLAERGHRRALLWVLEGNVRARRFYERQGWSLGRPIRLEEIGPTQVTEVRYEKGLGAG